jgi:hypothetical protein
MPFLVLFRHNILSLLLLLLFVPSLLFRLQIYLFFNLLAVGLYNILFAFEIFPNVQVRY